MVVLSLITSWEACGKFDKSEDSPRIQINCSLGSHAEQFV